MHKRIILGYLSINILCAVSAYAESSDVITIIGPDGLPMIVPHPERLQSKKQQSQSSPPQKKSSIFNFLAKKQRSEPEPSRQLPASSQPDQPEQQQTRKVIDISDQKSKQASRLPVITPASVKAVPTQNVQQNTVNERSDHTSSKQPPIQDSSPVQVVKTEAAKAGQSGKSEDLPYRLIDGEKYYETEYLESKEFNLENKKRFYQIPTGTGDMAGGASNWDVVEREKGVDMSWFNTRNNANTADQQEAVILGQSYKIIAKEDLIAALPLQCIDDKAKRKSKIFKKDDTLSLFPTAPFNDEFDYELIALSQPIQNFKLTSYANGNKSPTYYWPIAVFLDEQGCIIEGASAFHTRSYPSTLLQNEAVEGVIHVPQKSKYVMLSALEQAADLPELKLSHQGQIKLTVLR